MKCCEVTCSADSGWTSKSKFRNMPVADVVVTYRQYFLRIICEKFKESLSIIAKKFRVTAVVWCIANIGVRSSCWVIDKEIRWQLIKQSINQSINQLIKQSIEQSINQSINQSIEQSIKQSIKQKKSINNLYPVAFCPLMVDHWHDLI